MVDEKIREKEWASLQDEIKSLKRLISEVEAALHAPLPQPVTTMSEIEDYARAADKNLKNAKAILKDWDKDW